MRVFAAIAVVALIGVAGIQPAASSPDMRSGTVLIFGDSTSSQYTDDPGDPQQGWWSKLAAERSLYPVTSAQAGGGIIKKGYGCSGTAIRERAKSVIERARPDEIWVAAGRNDLWVCIGGKVHAISPSFRGRAAKTFFAQLASYADAAGVDRRNVYITTVWGTRDIRQRHDVVMALWDGANAAGLRYINLPRLPLTMTRTDGTHPNAAGSSYIAEYLAPRMAPHVGASTDEQPPAATSVQ